MGVGPGKWTETRRVGPEYGGPWGEIKWADGLGLSPWGIMMGEPNTCGENGRRLQLTAEIEPLH